MKQKTPPQIIHPSRRRLRLGFPINFRSPAWMTSAITASALSLASAAMAADIFKADNTDALNLTTSWTNGVVPTSTDVAVWDHNVTSGNSTLLGANTTWDGIRIADPAGVVSIGAGSTLTLGAAGIDMSSASQDLSMTNIVALSSTDVQTWKVGAGRVLDLEGSISRGQPGGVLKFDTTAGGTVTLPGVGASAGMLYSLVNGTDIGYTDISSNLSTRALVSPGYTVPVAGQKLGSQYCDIQSGVTSGDDINNSSPSSTIDYPRIIRFNTPHPYRNYWQISANNGQFSFNKGPTPNVFLFTPNLGADDVYFTSAGGQTLRWGQSSPGSELIIMQENTNGTVYFGGNCSQKYALSGNTITKSGAGKVVFNSAIPITGITRVLEGEMDLFAGAVNNGPIAVNGGATLRVGSATQLTASITVADVGKMAVGDASGAGSQTVSSGVTLANSTLQFYGASIPTTNTTALLVANGAGLTINGTVTVDIFSGALSVGTYPLIESTNGIAGAGSFVLGTIQPHVTAHLDASSGTNLDLVVDSVSQPLTWTNSSSAWDFASDNWQDSTTAGTTYQENNGLGDSVVFEDSLSGAGPITVSLDTAVSPATILVNNSSKDYTISGSGSIIGGANLTKQGTGTLTLGTANTFSGGLKINGGTVAFSALNNLGGGAISFDGGTLQYGSGNTADISTKAVTFGAGGATINVGANDVTFANAIGNGGAGGLTKAGSGTLTVNGDNTYSGNTVISEGTLALNGIVSFSNSPAIIKASGALFDSSLAGGYTLSDTASQAFYGEGDVSGGLTVPAGTKISPGTNDTIATLNFTNFASLNISGTLEMNVTTTGSDFIQADYVNIAPGAIITIPSPALTNGLYKLMQANQSWSGPASYFSFALGQAGKSGDLVLDSTTYAPTNILYLVVSDLASDDITWTGTNVPPIWDAANTNWITTVGANAWVFTNGDTVRFDETGASYSSVNLNGVLKPSLVVVSNPVTAYSFNVYSGSDKLAGSGSLIKQGAASLTIGTLNENTGPTTIQEGTVTVTGSLGSGAVTNNADLSLTYVSPETITSISGTGNLTQGGADATVSGKANYTGSTTIIGGSLIIGSGGPEGVLSTSAITNNGTLVLNSSTDWNYNMSDTGTGNLTKNGTNTLTLSGANTRTGATRVNTGTLVLGNANQISIGTADVEAGGKLDMNGKDQLVLGLNSTVFSGGLIVNNAGGMNTLTVSNNLDSDCSATVKDNDGSGGSIAFVKQGTGLLNWRGANTYTGPSTLEAGNVRISSATPFGANTNEVHMKGATLTYANASSMGYLNPTYVDPSINGTTNTIGVQSGGFPGTPFIGTQDLVIDFATGGNNDTFSPYGAFFDNLTNTIYFVGTGGWLRLDTVANLHGVTFDFRDSGVTINANKSTDVFIGGIRGGTNAWIGDSEARRHLVGYKNANETYSGHLNGNFSWVKVGSGTWTLDGTGNYVATNVVNAALSYTGSTTVSNGVLHLINGANPTNSSGFQIASGAMLDLSGMGYQVFETNELDAVTNTYTAVTDTLDLSTNANGQTLTGGGTIRGSVVAYGDSTINPGDGIGTLTVETNVTLGGTLVMELNTTNGAQTNDMLVVGGALTIGGTLTVSNLGPALVGGDTFQLFPGAINESGFTATNLPALTGVKYWVDNLAVDGSISVVDPINPNPPVMQVSYNGGTGIMSLAWPTNSGWILQSNSVSLTDTNAWYEYPPGGSTSITNVDITVDPASPNVFFRMLKP